MNSDSQEILYTRRHSRWYEIVLLSYIFQFITGSICIIALSAVPIWGLRFWEAGDTNIQTSLLAGIFSFFISTFSLRKLFRLPGSESVAYVLPIAISSFAIPVAIILLFRYSYSIQVFTTSFLVTLAWCYAGFFLGRRYRKVRYALLPFPGHKDLLKSNGALFKVIEEPNLRGQRFNAIVADFENPKISPEWEKFLAQCTLARIPVYSERRIREIVTGRVKINHLSENVFGSLLPSQSYEFIKRIIDLITAILIIPICIPFFILVSFFIKLESKGPALFIQPRMGFRGKVFRMLKFRSMYIDKHGSGFTDEKGDPRITKIGRFIRKYRIDEFPQIFNILMGQMSFIGPRPESYELSQWYEEDVPFFSYRHVVRPGLSGWAQVEQGYAAEVDGMKLKLEYDFYYIKYFSFWLDLLITFKTIKTILTGFGAR